MLKKFIVILLSINSFASVSPNKSISQKQKNSPERVKKKLSTAEQFSGAILWTHRDGIKGGNQTVLIIEQEDISDYLKARLEDRFRSDPLLKEKKSSIDHATTVVNALSKIAPESKIALVSLDSILTEDGPLKEWVKASSVINLSQGHTLRFIQNIVEEHGSVAYDLFYEKQNQHIEKLKNFMTHGEEKLLFIAAGNEKISISEPIAKWKDKALYLISKEILSDRHIEERTIIVGGINQFFRESPSSNFPGTLKLVQDSFILTLGVDIKLLNNREETLQSGTSFASPIVAGCALLLRQKYPHFPLKDLKEVMLESASKSFFIEKDPVQGIQKDILIYDPKDSVPSLGSLGSQKNNPINLQPFNPELYGKGVLDLRAAFIYADLKVKNPDWDKVKLRKEMNQILNQQNNQAAVTIQNAFRKYQAQKKSKPVKKKKFNGKNRK